MTANVEENIKKARRSAYSLLGGGFHGHNGFDVETIVHLYKIYISPVLLFGLELRDRPFNFQEGYGFFLKKYSDSQCC
jgi:hypothetical protein